MLVSCQREAGPATVTAAPTATPSVRVNEVAASIAPGVKLDPKDPATCEPCHGAVVTEWRESLHSRSHHSKDALYAALRALRLEKQGPAVAAACAGCHNPADVVDHDSKAAAVGVGCATCHQLDGVHLEGGKKGVAALVPASVLRFRGPHTILDGTSPVHGTGAALPALEDGTTLCLACHGEEKTPSGLATCSTGPEHASAPGAGSCASCHMKEVDGPSGAVSKRDKHRSHRFVGPAQGQRLGEVGILEEAVALTGRFDGNRVITTLENRSAHAFPTGFPARLVMLELRALDAAGKELARNIRSDPMKEHPEAVLGRAYVDRAGKPALAPFADKLARDSRLRPAETRTIAYAVPTDTRRVELRLRYFLLAPPAAKLLGYAGPETKPVTLAPRVLER